MKQAKKFFKMVDKKVAEALLIGAIFAFLLMTSARFIFKQPESIHFHANMAVFIDGKRELFAGPGYYEGELYNVIRNGRGVPSVPLVIVGIAP